MLKTIIFDFDQTMYTGNIGNIKLCDKKLFIDTFGDDGKYEMFVEKYNIDKKDMKDMVDACFLEGLDGNKLSEGFSNSVFQHIINDRIEILPNQFFKALAEKYVLYIVSMSQIKYLNFYFNRYDIDASVFKDVVCMDLIRNKTKAELYQIIMQKENNKPEEMLMIGDNIFHDIQPAQNLGMKTLHFNKCDFNQIYDYFTSNHILDCTKFKDIKKFYPNEK